MAQWSRIRLQCRRCKFRPWVEKIPWRRKWQLTPVILPGKSHGQKSLVHYIPRVTKSDMTERPSTHYTNWWVCVKAHKLYIKLTWSSQWHFEVGIIIIQMGKSRLTFFTCKACHMKILELPLGEMWGEFALCDVLCGPLITSTLIPYSTSLWYSWDFCDQCHSWYRITQCWARCLYTTRRFVHVLKQFFSGVTVMMQLYLMGLTTAGKLTKT